MADQDFEEHQTLKTAGLCIIYVLLFFSAWGLFKNKKTGYIAYYIQIPLRFPLLVLSIGFITIIPEALSIYDDVWIDWLFRLCIIAEIFRLYFTIRFHQKLVRR